MSELKTDKYIITGVKPNIKLPGHRDPAEQVMDGTGGMPTRVMWLDGEVVEGGFYTECVWIWPHCSSEEAAAPPHRHPFKEVVAFFGTNFDDPQDLGGEIEFWIDGERHVMTRSFLAYVPANMEHGPLISRRVDRPIFHFTMSPSQQYA